MKKNTLKAGIALTLCLAILTFYLLGGQAYFELSFLQQQLGSIQSLLTSHTVLFTACFFFLYVSCTALSLPIAALLTLLAGAIFGFWWALLLVSFASTLGATLAFLAARFIFKDYVQTRFADALAGINKGFAEEGIFYIFALRMIPVFPFFVINLSMAVLPVRAWTFYWVSQIGMLPGTAVYVFAGTELAKLSSLQGILSPTFILAVSLLGLFPIITKKALGMLRQS